MSETLLGTALIVLLFALFALGIEISIALGSWACWGCSI